MVSLALSPLVEIDKLRNFRMYEYVVAAISPRKSEPEAFHQIYHIREPDIFRSGKYLLQYLALCHHIIRPRLAEREAKPEPRPGAAIGLSDLVTRFICFLSSL
jgi:hypothetical protein